MKKFLIRFGIVIGIFIIAMVVFVSIMKQSDEKFANLSINEIDLTNVEDGEYNGKYNIFPISVEVRVTVENKKIVKIDILKHSNGQGGAAEEITDRVVEAQSVEIDTVAGATMSSKVILKAIEVAIKKH